MVKQKIFFMFAFLFLLSMSLVLAVDFSPQGNINLKNRYNITNNPAGVCSGSDFVAGTYPNGSWKCANPATGTEVDPFWSENFTLYNGTWASTYNVTYDTWAYNQTIPSELFTDTFFVRFTEIVGQVGNWTADMVNYYTSAQVDSEILSANNSMVSYVDGEIIIANATMATYVESINSSQSSWTDNWFVRFTELVGQVGNWTLDKPNYYTSTQVDTEITNANNSMTSYVDAVNGSQQLWVDTFFPRFTELVSEVGNWTLDKTNYYTSAQVDSGFVDITGDTMTGDLTTTNLTVSGSLYLDGSRITPLEANALIDGSVVAIMQTNPPNQELPHLILQSGGSQQASVILRSLMIQNEINDFSNTTAVTDCLSYSAEIGEELKIDCNTTTTGADLLVSDDLQVNDEVWIKDSEGSWHFLTRSLSLMDELLSNLLLNEMNFSLVGTNLTFNGTHGDSLVVNIDANETIFPYNQDSISIVEGTNITPIKNWVYYTDKKNPTLTVSGTQPTGDYAEVGRLIQGAGYTYGSIIDKQSQEKAINGIFKRFFSQGPLYDTGYTQGVNATNINFTGGTMIMITHEDIEVSELGTQKGAFYLEGADYIQFSDISDINEYSDGTLISNNKYFNVVFGVIHNDLGDNRLIAIVQDGTTEYNSVSTAEIDLNSLTNFFPSDTELTNLFIPTTRVVMKRTSGTTNTIQTLGSGNLFIDLRGIISSAGGASAGPGITDHGALTGLLDDDHTQYLLSDASRALSANWAQGVFNFTTTTSWFLGITQALQIDGLQDAVGDFGFFDDIANFTGTLTDTKACTYDLAGNEIDCDTTLTTGTVTSVAAGNGLDFTTITGSGSVTLGTPGSLTAGTSNAVTTTSHTHAVSGFLESLVDDTTPQLGGYLDTNTNNIGSTTDEIENVYVATDSRIYFGDGQEVSMRYNGTALIIG